MRRCADNVGRRVDTEVSTPRLAGTATPLHLRRLCPAPTYDHVVAQRRPLRRRQRHLPSEHVNSTAHRHKHPRGRVRSFSNSRGVRTQGGISPKNAKIRLSNTHTTVLRPFFREHPGELVPEENFWTLWCKGKINRGRHTDHPAGRHSVRTKQCPPPPSPHFLQVGCPSCHPTNSVKALKATRLSN